MSATYAGYTAEELARMRIRDAIRLWEALGIENGIHEEGVFELAAKEIERLRAIVDRLPKTEDGVIVVPGMNLWCNSDRGEYQWLVTAVDTRGYCSGTFHGCSEGPHSTDHCYSTREAAQRALEANE